jgi:dolichol-phosphate mannosyltransferase
MELIYDRDPRFAGTTKYSFSKMTNLALSAITNFSTKPLRMAFIGSLLSLAVAFSLTCFMIFQKLFSPEDSTQGYTSIVIIILISFGIQMFTLGVLGEYLAKNFIQSKHRPHYFVSSLKTAGLRNE